MTQIILDVSANTHRNDEDRIREIIESVPPVPPEHEIVFKTQLWTKHSLAAKVNRTCTLNGLSLFLMCAKLHGYQATSSVFDLPSLTALLGYDVPFVKIACRPDLYWLIGEVPRKLPVYVSVDCRSGRIHEVSPWPNWTLMWCVPEYPANINDYIHAKDGKCSDHTDDLDLWHKYKWEIFEIHYVLERGEKDNPDAGPFAKTPNDLKDMLR